MHHGREGVLTTAFDQLQYKVFQGGADGVAENIGVKLTSIIEWVRYRVGVYFKS